MKKVVVHSKWRVFDGFFKVDEAELSFERFDGTMTEPLRRLCFERGDSVAVVIYDRDSEVAVFVEQFKYPTYEKGPGWIMETVAGMVEPDETLEDAVAREVLEETGYEVEALEAIATFYVSPGGSSERVILYYAEVHAGSKVGEGGGLPSEGEDVQTIEYGIGALREMLAGGRIQDAKTIVGVQWLLNRHEQPG
jgi:nudix-type nucleoside diphosphatase (YffH/AdpP family)